MAGQPYLHTISQQQTLQMLLSSCIYNDCNYRLRDACPCILQRYTLASLPTVLEAVSL